MTVQELIDQLLAFCAEHGREPSEAKAMIDFGCDYAGVESLDWYLDSDDEFAVVLV